MLGFLSMLKTIAFSGGSDRDQQFRWPYEKTPDQYLRTSQTTPRALDRSESFAGSRSASASASLSPSAVVPLPLGCGIGLRSHRRNSRCGLAAYGSSLVASSLAGSVAYTGWPIAAKL